MIQIKRPNKNYILPIIMIVMGLVLFLESTDNVYWSYGYGGFLIGYAVCLFINDNVSFDIKNLKIKKDSLIGIIIQKIKRKR
jgi:hypothetical protein